MAFQLWELSSHTQFGDFEHRLRNAAIVKWKTVTNIDKMPRKCPLKETLRKSEGSAGHRQKRFLYGRVIRGHWGRKPIWALGQVLLGLLLFGYKRPLNSRSNQFLPIWEHLGIFFGEHVEVNGKQWRKSSKKTMQMYSFLRKCYEKWRAVTDVVNKTFISVVVV